MTFKDAELIPLFPCPHCGGKAILVKEAKQFIKKLNKKVQYARIVCINNSWSDYENRCLAKTVAYRVDEVIKHWNKRHETHT